jgi:hypothetical protein
MKIKIVIIVLLVIVLAGCGTLKATSSMVATRATMGEIVKECDKFETEMTAFLNVWPTVSGVLEGFFRDNRTTITAAMTEARKAIDEVEARGVGDPKNKTWTQKDLGLAFGYASSLFNAAIEEFIVEQFPSLVDFFRLIKG